MSKEFKSNIFFADKWIKGSEEIFSKLLEMGVTPMYKDYTEELYPNSTFHFNEDGSGFISWTGEHQGIQDNELFLTEGELRLSI